MEKRAQRVCHAAADMYECDCQIRFMGSAGGVACDAALVERVCRVLPQVDGVRSVLADTDFGGAEDITTMMRQVQKHGGQATEMILAMPLKAPHHNSFFDIDEQVIGLGARIFAQLVMTEPDGKIS